MEQLDLRLPAKDSLGGSGETPISGTWTPKIEPHEVQGVRQKDMLRCSGSAFLGLQMQR